MAENNPAIEIAPEDAQENKLMAILAYILCIPLFTGAYKTSPFVKFHLNQSIILWALDIALWIVFTVLGVIPGVRVITSLLLYPLAGLALVVLVILGILNANKGKAKPLPLIGSLFTALK